VARGTRRFEVRVWADPDGSPGGGDRTNGADAPVRGAVRDLGNGIEQTFDDAASMLARLRRALDRQTDRW
jgi:hypothetical protein